MNEREEIRRLIWLAKVLAVLMIVLMIVEFMSCAREAKGAVITGEKPLGGGSLLLQMVIDKELGVEDIDLNLLRLYLPGKPTERKNNMAWVGFTRHYDAHLYQGGTLVPAKIYHDVKTIKINKQTNRIEVFMEDGTSVPVNADRYTVEIKTRDKWGL